MWDRLIHLFDWSVKTVCEPEPFYHQQMRGQIAAYQVVVTYNYHGTSTQYFPVGKYGDIVCSRVDAWDDAMNYYHKMQAKIRNMNTR